MKYLALLDYASTLGAFATDDVVELAEGVARAINRDQPRTLIPAPLLPGGPSGVEGSGEDESDGEAEPADASVDVAAGGNVSDTTDTETRTLPSPPQDRMIHRAPRNRAKAK